MLKRRHFLGSLTALSASYLLAACGGGSGAESDKASAASGASGTAASLGGSGSGVTSGTTGNTTPVAKASGPNSISIPPAASITDISGNVWTLSGGSVYRNGSAADDTYNVSLVLFYGGVICHEGTGGQFYGWTGSGWMPCNDPRLGGISADGTSLPASAYIIDIAGAIWTLWNSVIYRNGATVGDTYNVSLLLWYRGVICHEGTGGQFYGWTGSGWMPCSDPRLGGTSADGTSLPASAYIIDIAGAIWTLWNSVIYRNGATVGDTYNVSLLLWYRGVICHEGTGGQFYGWTGSGWMPCRDPRLGGTSADGTSLPATAYIIDIAGAIWTLWNGVIYRNGATVGDTYNVSLLLWYHGVICHQGTGGQFYGWTGSGWMPCSDPRLGGTSADGTSLPASAYIIDKSGNIWTLWNGVIYCNGATVGDTYNVSLLLWYHGAIYHEGTGGEFYEFTGSGWIGCNDPRLGGTSADGTTLPASAYIVDKSGNLWTLSGGVIYCNGGTVGDTYNVSLVLWYGGKI
jgi:hypothetical protein